MGRTHTNQYGGYATMKRNGFSLVELFVVFAIIAVLAAILLGGGCVERKQVQDNLGNVLQAMATYTQDGWWKSSVIVVPEGYSLRLYHMEDQGWALAGTRGFLDRVAIVGLGCCGQGKLGIIVDRGCEMMYYYDPNTMRLVPQMVIPSSDDEELEDLRSARLDDY